VQPRFDIPTAIPIREHLTGFYNKCMDDFSPVAIRTFSLSAIFSFLESLRYRQTQTSSGNVANIQPRYE